MQSVFNATLSLIKFATGVAVGLTLAVLLLAPPKAHCADVQIGQPFVKTWNVCLKEEVAKSILDMYTVSGEAAFFAYEQAEKSGACATFENKAMTLDSPVYAVTGEDGGKARVFKMKPENGVTYYSVIVQ